MAIADLQAGIEKMKAMVEPWHRSLADPQSAQQAVLERLVGVYQQTEYGRNHQAHQVGCYEDLIHAFPIQTYAE